MAALCQCKPEKAVPLRFNGKHRMYRQCSFAIKLALFFGLCFFPRIDAHSKDAQNKQETSADVPESELAESKNHVSEKKSFLRCFPLADLLTDLPVDEGIRKEETASEDSSAAGDAKDDLASLVDDWLFASTFAAIIRAKGGASVVAPSALTRFVPVYAIANKSASMCSQSSCSLSVFAGTSPTLDFRSEKQLFKQADIALDVDKNSLVVVVAGLSFAELDPDRTEEEPQPPGSYLFELPVRERSVIFVGKNGFVLVNAMNSDFRCADPVQQKYLDNLTPACRDFYSIYDKWFDGEKEYDAAILEPNRAILIVDEFSNRSAEDAQEISEICSDIRKKD